MSVSVDIKKISAHFIWIMGMLEAITVPLVVLLPSWTGTALKNPLHGVAVGFAGVVVLFCFINLLMGKLNLRLLGIPVTGVSIFSSALWSGLILASIFAIQSIGRPVIGFIYPAREALVGFLSAGGAILLCGLIYRVAVSRMPILAVEIWTPAGVFRVTGFSLWRLSFFSGLYEGIALPVILIWGFFPVCQGGVAVLTGLTGGIAGGGLIWLLSRMFSKPAFFILEKVSTLRTDGSGH